MEKEQLIEEINNIISNYGSFSIGEVEADCSPCVNSMGTIVALAEEFDTDEATIEIYNCKGVSSDAIDSYTLKYEEMEIKTLEEILELAKKYENNQI